MTMKKYFESKTASLMQAFFAVAFLFLNTTQAAQVAKEKYSMNLQTDCISIGKLDVARDQTIFLNGMADPSESRNNQAASCSLRFGPQTSGDSLEVILLPNSYIENCQSSLTIAMTPGGQYILGCQSDSGDFPRFEAQDGEVTVRFVRPDISVSNYQFQVSVRAFRTVDKEPPGGVSNSADVGMIVGIIAGVVIFVVILCVVCICCWRRRRESLQEKRQFINGGVSGAAPGVVAGMENGVYSQGVRPESPASNRRLLSKRDGSSEDGGSSVDGKSKSALDRFGPAPSRRRQQQVRPNEDEVGRRRDAFQTENESDGGGRRPQMQPRNGGLRRGAPVEDYEDVGADRRAGANRSPQGSPLLSDLRSNPRFRRSFHENEVDAEDRARRVSDHTSSAESQDSREPGVTRRPSLPRVPRSPSRSPSPQRRGEKIAAIYRARPSSSVDAARLDSDRSEDTPPIEETDNRDTRHVLRPNRDGRGQPIRGKSRDRDDYDNSDDDRRPSRQARRNREDEPRQRDRYKEDESDEEDRRRRREKKKREEEQRRLKEEREREEEERRKKQEKKKKEEERRRKEEEAEERRAMKAPKESDGSEYEGRFKKSASGRKSKGKGPRMGRSRSTGNALEEMDDKHRRSRSKSPGSAHSLNFIEDEDETDLDSNYQPFRRAGSKTSLYASRSSLYGRRRKNSLGETVSVSSRTALDDTDSRMGDFDRSRMSQTELRRLYKSTGELDMRPESAHVVREVGTSTSRGGSATVYGRKTLAKGRHGKRYSRGTQTPPSRSGRERRDSVGSSKSGRSAKHKLKSRSRSRESLGGRRSRSRGRTDEEDEVSDDSSDDNRSRRSGHSSHKPRKSRSHYNSGEDDDDERDNIADDQSVAPSSIAPSSVYGAVNPAAYGQYPQYPAMMPAPGYPQMVYQPVVAPGGPPAAGAPPGMIYQMAPQPMAAPPQKPPIAPKPQPKPKPSGSRWDELVNLTDGMKQRRRQMGESVTEDGTESMLSSMWSQPTYNSKHQPVQQQYAPPSYKTAQRLAGPDLSYSSNYADSSDAALMPPRNTRMASYSPSESNI